MITYVAHNQGSYFGYFCGRYPDLIGNLFSPGRSFSVFPFAHYALDNGAFVAWEKRTAWDEAAWRKMLDTAQSRAYAPRWVLVPDVVADRERTIENWHRYYPVVRAAGFTAAFAVQDEMMPADVPPEAQVIFVGGTTAWKWRTIETWCELFPRVHVGRVNSYGKLLRCFNASAESTDGTGWFKGRARELHALCDFLEFVSGRKSIAQQRSLFGAGNAQRTLDPVARTVREIAYYRPRNENNPAPKVADLSLF